MIEKGALTGKPLLTDSTMLSFPMPPDLPTLIAASTSVPQAPLQLTSEMTAAPAFALLDELLPGTSSLSPALRFASERKRPMRRLAPGRAARRTTASEPFVTSSAAEDRLDHAGIKATWARGTQRLGQPTLTSNIGAHAKRAQAAQTHAAVRYESGGQAPQFAGDGKRGASWALPAPSSGAARQ